MKKKYKILVGVLLICLSLCACGKSSQGQLPSDGSDKMYITNNTTTETTKQDVTKASEEYDLPDTVNGYITENDKGFVELKQYSNRSGKSDGTCSYESSFDKNKNNYFIFVWKNANENIPKIKKDSIVGVTSPYSEIKYIPISETKPQYFVPINFFEDKYNFYGDTLTGTNSLSTYRSEDNIDFSIKKDADKLTDPGNPIIECNGEDIGAFIDNNSVCIYKINTMSSDGYKLIKGEKNQAFTFGGYVGTEWKEFTSKACVAGYSIYRTGNNESITQTIPTQKTKDGYFSVDFSNLDSGIYYITTFNTFIELV